MALSTGTKAPNFILPSTSGTNFTLGIDKIGKPLIIYFYPSDFRPASTNEACGFRDAFNLFRSYDIDIVGISKNSIASHLEFKEAYNLPFELLSDETSEVAQMYDVQLPLVNFTRRTTYLLDATHKIIVSYENMFISIRHIEEMMKQIKTAKFSS